MANNSSERSGRGDRVPPAPAPLAASARDGAEHAREEVRRYLPNLARALLGIGLHPDAAAGLHTRTLAIGKLLDIAGVSAALLGLMPRLRVPRPKRWWFAIGVRAGERNGARSGALPSC
jgi:hypothetical protein